MTLAVHPLFGQELAIVSGYGAKAVWAETLDGKLRLLPLAWTSLSPRPGPVKYKGQAVRLAPEALREIAEWVAARMAQPESSGCKKFAFRLEKEDKERNGRGSSRALVGQTRSQEAGGRGHKRPRGKR